MKGFLFIGDPHVTSIRPGRRRDDFVASVLGKLSYSAELCHSRELVPVILGDLFHRAHENHMPTLNRLSDVLKQFPITPIVLGGNHDKSGSLIGPEDSLRLLGQLGAVELFDGESRLAKVYDFEGQSVALWVVPYGAAVPDSVPVASGQTVVMITHHDFAFEGAYPGADLLKEIKGCSLVVNGHMHKTSPSIQMGQTRWHNPGNIEPLSVDCIDHIPAVWAWTPAQGQSLERNKVPHNRDCFDLTGLTVAPAKASEAVEAVVAPVSLPMSHFAELLSAEVRLEGTRAEDPDEFVKDIEQALEAIKGNKDAKALLLALARSG
jgi:predicted phosphodiesterase